MSAEQGTTDVIAVLEGLGVAVRTVRLMRGLSLRAAADEAGVSFSTLTRIEQGEDHRVTSAIPLLRWIAAPPDYQPEDFTDEAVEFAQSIFPKTPGEATHDLTADQTEDGTP